MMCKHILLIMLLNDSKLIHLDTVTWFEVLLCISNVLIKNLSFVYTRLRGAFNKFPDFFLYRPFKLL